MCEQRNGKWTWSCVAGVSMATVAACGGITITKIPWKGDYSAAYWTDEKQKEVDSIQGTRYYLPWPSLVVTKEFPVATSACFISGTLSADGKYIDLDDATLKFLNAGGALAFSARLSTESLAPQAEQLQANTGSLRRAKPAATPRDGGATKDGGGFETDGGGGSASASSTGGNGTEPIVLSEFLSIEYMPDERQQYAVKTSGTIQDMKMQLTNGWMLESTNYHVDNSAVIKLIEDTVGTALPAIEKLIPGLQAEVAKLQPSAAAPTVVTIKAHTISYAVPGTYRRLRPEEAKTLAASISLTPTVKPGDVVACSPDRELPSYYPVGATPGGVDFLLQTRSERFLEVQTVAKAAMGGEDGDDSGGPARLSLAATCPGVAVAQFKTWAKKQNPPIDTNASPPKVLSAVAGGKVVVAIQFPKTETAAQQTAILNQAKTIRGSDLSSGPCNFPTGQIVVCAYGQPGCVDTRADSSPPSDAGGS